MIPDGYAGQFRMRCWPDATRGTRPYEVSSGELSALRAAAVSFLGQGVYGLVELSAWNIELNDWVRLERLER
ncbi:MAG TPA: hypothetical protein VKQ54_07350 [Caulobacteraceae bacterium]|nr:hypothetical protein [Caulobacteraceae bacterium]